MEIYLFPTFAVDKVPHKAACALREQQQQDADCVMINRDVRWPQ